MDWLFNGNPLLDKDIPSDAEGFVYMITHIPTQKFYIGKKTLKFKRKSKIGKRELSRIKEERKLTGQRGSLPKTKLVIKESDWRDYYSSNDDIKDMVKEGNASQFKREVLKFCSSKKSLSYYEVKYQFEYGVLESDNSFNSNILGKFFKRDLE